MPLRGCSRGRTDPRYDKVYERPARRSLGQGRQGRIGRTRWPAGRDLPAARRPQQGITGGSDRGVPRHARRRPRSRAGVPPGPAPRCLWQEGGFISLGFGQVNHAMLAIHQHNGSRPGEGALGAPARMGCCSRDRIGKLPHFTRCPSPPRGAFHWRWGIANGVVADGSVNGSSYRSIYSWLMYDTAASILPTYQPTVPSVCLRLPT